MDKITMNAMEVLIGIVLIYGVLRYWKWKLQVGYDVKLTNKAYGIFLAGQILNVIIMLVSSMDPQNFVYLESLTLFGEGAFNYWTVIGVQLSGIVLIFVVSNVMGHILYNITLKEQLGLHDEIREENTAPVLVVTVIILVIGYTTSLYALRPYIFEWISSNSGLMPVY